jgi:hypothetical protein
VQIAGMELPYGLRRGRAVKKTCQPVHTCDCNIELTVRQATTQLKQIINGCGAACDGTSGGVDMELQVFVSTLAVVGVMGWLARHYTRHLSYRASCRNRLRSASA